MKDPNSILAQKIALGDEKAFEEIYMRHYPKVFGYANQYMHNQEEARNVAQETFMDLWCLRESINSSLNLVSYLMVITRNKCLNLLRSEMYAKKYTDYVMNKRMQIDYEALADVSAQRLIEAEITERIDNLLDMLPSKTKEAFILSRHEELTYAEIAEKMEVSVKMVEYRIMQALKYLRINLKDYFDESRV